jgi:hypothetical protein
MLRRLTVAACLATGLVLAAAAIAAASGSLEFSHNWGGSGDIPGRHRHNFCSTHDIRPGESRPVHVVSSYDNFTGTVFCSHVFHVHHNTTGPWNDGHWISVPCPHGQRPMLGGAGFDSTPEDALTFVAGSFGHNHDGFWHYRFHNWNPRDGTIEFWAVCLNKQ